MNFKKVPQNDLEKIIKSIKENPSLTREQLAVIIGKSVKTVGRITKEPKLITFQLTTVCDFQIGD